MRRHRRSDRAQTKKRNARHLMPRRMRIDKSGYIRDQRGRLLPVANATSQHHEHVWLPPGRIHDRRIVRDGRDLAGLMRDARARRKAGGNLVIEFLREQNVSHQCRAFW